MIIWLIGLSGAGKSTVASEIVAQLRSKGRQVVFLDGDLLREVWPEDVDHSMAGRERNAARVSRLCAMLDRQGFWVVAAILSIFPEWQKWNRETFSSYYQVHLDVARNVLEARDSKGLYAAARSGKQSNIVGIDLPFPQPYQSDLVLTAPLVLRPPQELATHIIEQALR